MVLEQCYWSTATKAIALGLVLDQNTLTNASQIVFPGWRYIYARPTDCLKAQAVTSAYGLRANPFMSYWWRAPGSMPTFGGPWRPAWREVLDQVANPPNNSIDIVTDQDSAWLVYTCDITNLAIYPEVLVDAIAWQLAILVCGPVSANQRAKEMALKMAPMSMSKALAQNLNEEQPDAYPESPSIQARL
jgi:hypothetical protein